MEEYSRIVIEGYCRTHPKTKKSVFLSELVELSYTMESEPEDWQMMYLSQLISKERNSELKEALEDLDQYLCG
ncbi:MAG: hypothetical protein RR214_05840 [Synergistaceae bacterium]